MSVRFLVMFALLGVLCSVAVADGGFVLPPLTQEDIKEGIREAYLDEPEQNAIIVYDGENETLYLQARYEGNVEDFAWIVPVPSKPSVEKGRTGLMEEIADYFYQLKLEEWKTGRLDDGGIIALGEGEAKDSEKAPKPKKVRVVEAKRVGIYDLTVLEATDPEALSGWLKKHDFKLPDTEEAKEILDYYIKRKMYFCALRICKGSRRPSKKISKGWIQPVAISFRAEQPYYPLRITAIHSRTDAAADILIYLFCRPDSLSYRGEKRLSRRGFSGHEYRFEPKDLQKCCKAFPELGSDNYILRAVTGRVARRDLYGDLWFATQKEELAEPSAETLWFEALGPNSDLRTLHRNCREILADYPCTPWAAMAHERIEKMGKKARELAERDAQERTVAGHELVSGGRYSQAVEEFRRISRMYPWRAAEAALNMNNALSAEKKYLADLWDRLQEQKETGRKTKDYKDYYKTLVKLMLLCKNLHDDENIYDKALKKRYYAAGLAEVEWVDRYYAALMDKKFDVTWKEVQWQARRDPALAYRMCRKIIAIHPDTKYSKKATELLREMLR